MEYSKAVFLVDVVCGNYIGVLMGEFSWEVLFSILSLIFLVNLSHMGLVPIWLKFIKRFRKGVWGTTLLKRVSPSKYLIHLSACSAG